MNFNLGDLGNSLRYSVASNLPQLYLLGTSFLPQPGRTIERAGNLLVSTTTRTPPPDLESVQHITFVPGPGLGDALIMTPTFELLKDLKPNLHISVVASPSYSQVLNSLPGVDQVIPFSVPGNQPQIHPQEERFRYLMSTLLNFQQRSPSEVYVFNNSGMGPKTTEALKKLSGYKICGFWFNPIHNNAVNFDANVTAAMFRPFRLAYIGIQWGLSLLAPLFGNLGYLPTPDRLNEFVQPNLPQPLFETTRISEFQQKLSDVVDFTKPTIFLNFLAALNDRLTPLETAVRLTLAVSQKYPEAQIVINAGTGHKIRKHPQDYSERNYIHEFAQNITPLENVRILPQLSLEELAQLMFLCRYIFTVETGLMHLSASKQIAHVPSTVLCRHSGLQREWGIERDNRYYYSARQRICDFKKTGFEGLNQDDFIRFVLKTMGRHI